MAEYVEETVFEAPRDTVYELLADREGYNEFLPFTVKLVRPGATERQGVGAIHRIGVGPVGVKEEIIELVAGELIQYRVVAGLPVRSHIGTITLADHPRGTAVRYSMESTPLIPVPDAVMVWVLRKSMASLVTGARREAARRG
ncbi:SRPBCC family protein [Mycobacteroides franklinii]|uniref:SRPBCC family protein n=1 Tax=Mycobacteroides franklinii TaxID=948102 RepID=A0A4R5PDH8_9MYCO|nr:SRPBCC family protein [Mycobacteroides franklinii]ORA64496.1 MxaD family protein [Mycobacteroides franklinii]TDH22781.1 SRPBCC family protein [Mycobacteroides franklinii]